MRELIAFTCLAFALGVGYVLFNRLQPGALSVLAGFGCGLLAMMQSAILLLIILRQRHRHSQKSRPLPQHPPVIVIQQPPSPPAPAPAPYPFAGNRRWRILDDSIDAPPKILGEEDTDEPIRFTSPSPTHVETTAEIYGDFGVPVNTDADEGTDIILHSDTDIIREFIITHCTQTGEWRSATHLYEHYCTFSHHIGRKPASQHIFGRTLVQLNVPRKRAHSGFVYQIAVKRTSEKSYPIS